MTCCIGKTSFAIYERLIQIGKKKLQMFSLVLSATSTLFPWRKNYLDCDPEDVPVYTAQNFSIQIAI